MKPITPTSKGNPTHGAASEQAPLPAPSASPDPLLPEALQGWLKSVSPEAWNHPVTQVSLELAQDDVFKHSLADLNSSGGKGLLLWEIAFLVLFWTVQAWRLSKVSTWLSRLWVQAYMALVFVFGVLVLVPGWVWGKSYFLVLSHGFRALVRHFLT